MAEQLCTVFPNLEKEVVYDVFWRYKGNVEAAAEQLLTENASSGTFVLKSQETQESLLQVCHSWSSSPPARHSVLRGCSGDQLPSTVIVDEHRCRPLLHMHDNGSGPNGDVDQYGISACEPRVCDQSKKRGSLIIMRGLPGSGKSTLAKILAGHAGKVFSTDEQFMVEGRYCFDPARLGYCHEQNRVCAQKALEEGVSPVVIDNTNTTVEEMVPYVKMAMQYDYDVQLKEPDTDWKFDVEQLARKNSHAVSSEKLSRMLHRYQHHVTVESIMSAVNQLDEKNASSVRTPSGAPQCSSPASSTPKRASDPLHRRLIMSPGQGSGMPISSPEKPHANPFPCANDQLSQSKGLSEEQSASVTPPPTYAQQEVCHEYARHQPYCSSGLVGYQCSNPPPPCVVAVDHKLTSNCLPLYRDNESCSELTSSPPQESDSGLGSDLTPLTFHQFSRDNAPWDLVSYSSDSETAAGTFLMPQYGAGPVEDTGPSLLDDMHFLQEATGHEPAFLMPLYAKCCFDIERTVDIAFAYPTDSTELDVDRYCSISDNNETDSKQTDSQPSNLDPDMLETEGSVVPDSGGDLKTASSEDSNLTLKLNRSLATQLQKLFGPVDASLFCGGDEDLTVLLSENAAYQIYTKWLDTLKARKDAHMEEHRIQTMRKDAELAQRLQDEIENNGEYRQDEQGKKREAGKNYMQALVHQEQSSDQGTGHPSTVQKPTQNYASALVKENCEMLPSFKAQVDYLYKHFPKLDKGIVDTELVKNSYDFRSTVMSLKSQYTDTTDGNNLTISESLKQPQPNKSKSSFAPGMLAINTYRIDSHDECVTYNEIRTEAAIQAKLRAEAYQKAAQAKHRKDDATASHYLQEGKLCTKRMKEANQRAADLLIKIQQRPHTLDMHGLYVEEALQALEKRLKITEKGTSLIVITGRGSHSVSGIAKLKPAVMSFLKRRNYHYEELNAGTLQVFIY
eukprot:Em0011g539a